MTIFEFAVLLEELSLILEEKIKELNMKKEWEYAIIHNGGVAFGKGNEKHYIQTSLSRCGNIIEIQKPYMTLTPVVTKKGKDIVRHMNDTIYSFLEKKQLPVWIRGEKTTITFHPEIQHINKLTKEFSGKFFLSEEIASPYFKDNFYIEVNTDLFCLDVFYERKESSHRYKRLQTIEQVQQFKEEIFESEMKKFEDELIKEAEQKNYVVFQEETGWVYSESFLHPEKIRVGIQKEWEQANWRYGININSEYTKTLKEEHKLTALKHIEQKNKNLQLLRNIFDTFLTIDPTSYIIHDRKPYLILFGEKYSFVVSNADNHFSLYLSNIDSNKDYNFDKIGTHGEILVAFSAFVKKTFSPIRLERVFNTSGDPRKLFVVYSLGLTSSYKKSTWEFQEGLEEREVFQEIDHLFGSRETMPVFPKNKKGSVLTSSYQISMMRTEFTSKSGERKRRETIFVKTKEA